MGRALIVDGGTAAACALTAGKHSISHVQHTEFDGVCARLLERYARPLIIVQPDPKDSNLLMQARPLINRRSTTPIKYNHLDNSRFSVFSNEHFSRILVD